MVILPINSINKKQYLVLLSIFENSFLVFSYPLGIPTSIVTDW
jgi:hypothetical protein